MPRAIHRLAFGSVAVTAAAAAVLPIGAAAASTTKISTVHALGALPTAIKPGFRSS
jgi:hypothetical protein